jgi:hypothetical protein
MDGKPPPIYPYNKPSTAPRRSKGTAKNKGRFLTIPLLIAIMLFFGFYGGRAFYIAKINPPKYASVLREFSDQYCCSCEGGLSGFGKDYLFIDAHPFAFPLVDISLQTFRFHISLRPPDGSYRKFSAFIESHSTTTDLGYIYGYEDHIQLISDRGVDILIPIRWGKQKFLVERGRLSDFCGLRYTPLGCFYADNSYHEGNPKYLDGSKVCSQDF